MDPRIVTFYTSSYVGYFQALCASAERFGLQVTGILVEPFASWQEAVCFKPNFVLECLYSFGEASGILWVDADATIEAQPNFSIFENIDIAATKFRWSKAHQVERLTGTMFFRRSDPVIAFVEDWVASTLKWKKLNRDTPEQNSLREVWDLPIHAHLRKLDLPMEWTFIEPEFRTMFLDKDCGNPVISHHQASRKLKV